MTRPSPQTHETLYAVDPTTGQRLEIVFAHHPLWKKEARLKTLKGWPHPDIAEVDHDKLVPGMILAEGVVLETRDQGTVTEARTPLGWCWKPRTEKFQVYAQLDQAATEGFLAAWREAQPR